MGGHGGLNILPQKSWNVYNFDNREKVRKDEEAAAKEEQIHREESRKRDTEFRIEQLRTARGLAPSVRAAAEPSVRGPESKSSDANQIEGVTIDLGLQSKLTGEIEGSTETGSKSKSGHINLFEGLKFFDTIGVPSKEGAATDESKKKKKRKREDELPRVVTAEDEKYKLGYGIAGKGVKLPWYLTRPLNNDGNGHSRSTREEGMVGGNGRGGKKSLQELREERIMRESREKERERLLVREARKKNIIGNIEDGDQRSRRGFFRR